jgi:hypothetical protein
LFRALVTGYQDHMRMFKLRYALLGWLVARIARKRFERRLHAITVGAGRLARR